MENFDKYLDFLNGEKQQESLKVERENDSEAFKKETTPQQQERKNEKTVGNQSAQQKQIGPKPTEPNRSKIDKEGEKVLKQVLGMELPKVSEDVQKNIKAFTMFHKNMEERAKMPEFQELVKKREECFSPENEKLFMGYMLSRGFVTEEQAKAYLRKVIPHDENTKESDLEPTRLD